jgi:hypothetical protein
MEEIFDCGAKSTRAVVCGELPNEAMYFSDSSPVLLVYSGEKVSLTPGVWVAVVLNQGALLLR